MTIHLRRWLYFDHDGLASLHEQIRGGRVIERTKKVLKSSNKTVRGTGSLGGFGAKVEAGGDSASGSQYEIIEKMVPGDEKLLIDLENHLTKTRELVYIKSVRGIAEEYATNTNSFLTGTLRFRWASSHDTNPFVDATKKQMVEFELDRDACDDSGMLAVPVRMGGSLGKCIDRMRHPDGTLSPASHLAIFLRHLGNNAIPLGFFARLHLMPGLIWIKPYAIWFP